MNAETLRQKHYNCRSCEDNDFDKGNRVCFWFNGEVQEVQFVQDLEDKDRGIRICKQGERREVSAEDIDEILIQVMDADPRMSPLEALKFSLPNVCPKSLIDSEMDELVAMEAFCKSYNLRPLGDQIGYLDYPIKLREIFATISKAQERVHMKEIAAMRPKT